MTQTAQMTQSLSIHWILNKLFTGVFMEQDQEQEIMITIDEHVFFMAAWKTNYSLAFPWSKNIIDEHHVFFTFTINNCAWKRLENAALARSRKLQKNILVNNASCSLPFPYSRKNNGRATRFHGLHCSWFCVETLEKCSIRALGKTIEKRSGKKLYTSVFVEQENNQQTSSFHCIHRW